MSLFAIKVILSPLRTVNDTLFKIFLPSTTLVRFSTFNISLPAGFSILKSI